MLLRCHLHLYPSTSMTSMIIQHSIQSVYLCIPLLQAIFVTLPKRRLGIKTRMTVGWFLHVSYLLVALPKVLLLLLLLLRRRRRTIMTMTTTTTTSLISFNWPVWNELGVMKVRLVTYGICGTDSYRSHAISVTQPQALMHRKEPIHYYRYCKLTNRCQTSVSSTLQSIDCNVELTLVWHLLVNLQYR